MAPTGRGQGPPDGVADFYVGERSQAVPFCVNDCVEVFIGEHAGRRGAVISMEASGADPRFLVELGDTGEDVVLPASALCLFPESAG